MVTQMFGVQIRESVQTLRQALTSPSRVGLIGTLSGEKASEALNDGSVVHFAHAGDALSALTPDDGSTPTGTLWQMLQDVRARTNGEVLLLKVASLANPAGGGSSAINDNASKFSRPSAYVDASGSEAQLQRPTYLAAIDATVARTDEADLNTAFNTDAAGNFAALEAEAERIRAVVIATSPVIGDTIGTQRNNAIAYARNNRHNRAVLLDRRVGANPGMDPAAAIAATLMARDHDVGVGAYNLDRTEVNGIGQVYPKYEYELGGPLYASSDGKFLQEENIVQIARITGFQLVGSKMNVGTTSEGHTASPLDYFHAVRTSDTVYQTLLLQANGFFGGFIDGILLADFQSSVQAQLNDLIDLGSLTDGSATINEAATSGGRAVYDIELHFPQVPEKLEFDVAYDINAVA